MSIEVFNDIDSLVQRDIQQTLQEINQLVQKGNLTEEKLVQIKNLVKELSVCNNAQVLLKTIKPKTEEKPKE